MPAPRVCLLFPRFYEGFIMRKVPLGLAYLAAALQEAGADVAAYNLNVDPLEDVPCEDFEWFGITLLTPFIDEVTRMCAAIRAKNPTAKIVVGGAHPTYQTGETFAQLPDVDYAIVGEGEVAFPTLVTNEAARATIPGVYYRTADGVAGTPRKNVDLHTLAYPNQRIFDHGRLERRNPFRAMLASRGCPFKCRNCQPILNDVQPFRIRTPLAVVDEIEHLQRTYGQTYFGFLDSEFPLKKRWLLDFHALLRERGLAFEFHCNARSDLLDAEILALFKDLRITRLAIGVESGVERIIRSVLKKKIDLDETVEVFASARAAGVTTHAHFMIGIPGETLDDMRQTLAYAIALGADSMEFNMLTPWPGTAFYDQCVARGYLTEPNVARFNEKRASYITTEDFTHEQVEAFYEEIRATLAGLGYANSDDGSVYFAPTPATERKAS